MTYFEKTWTLSKYFGRDTRAVNAIEFALIGPLLVVLYLGSVEGFLTLQAKQEVSKASSMLAASVAKLDTAGSDEIVSAFSAGRLNFIRGEANDATLEATSIVYDSPTTGLGIWKTIYTSAGLADVDKVNYYHNETITVPNGVINSGETVVRARVTYTFENPIGLVLGGTFDFEEISYHQPRRTITNTSGVVLSAGVPRKYPDCASVDNNGIVYSAYNLAGDEEQQFDFTNADHDC